VLSAAKRTSGRGAHWVACLSLLALTGCRFGAPGGSTVQGQRIGNLYHLFFYVAIGVGAIVYALIIGVAVAYRRRKNDGDELPRQTRYNIPWEVTYTLIPLFIVIGLFVFTFRTEVAVDHVSKNPAVVVTVTGFQWQWRFDYPSGASVVGAPGSPPTMVVPVGQVVQINLFAQDVIHSFFVPDFLFKRDAIPGVQNRFDIIIPKAGVFRGECAEYCGLDHGDMTFYVQAVSPQQFQSWLASHPSGPGTSG
jgi:cytochrome c oxidase subunit 2